MASPSPPWAHIVTNGDEVQSYAQPEVLWPAPSESTNPSYQFSPNISKGTGMFSPANPTHAPPTRQRPNRRVNGDMELPFNNAGETSAKENVQRTSYKRSTSGPLPLHGGRRDRDRGSRDAQMQPQRGYPRPFFRGPSHANASYIAPPPIVVRPPFVTPMIYPGHEVPTPVFYAPGPHMDPFRAVPLVAPVGPVYFPLGDPHLQMKIVNQIEYYFSNANIVKDTYLRRNMDEQGWVPIKLIAGFNKVSELTDDVQLILAALQSSILLEVEGEKVRRREDWPNWIIPHSAQQSATSSPRSTPKSGNGMLAEHLQSLALNDDNIPSRSSSGEFSSH